MIKHNIVFHIGYPKAGSSSLQINLFDRLETHQYLGIIPTNNVGVSNPTVIENSRSEFLKNKTLKNIHQYIVGNLNSENENDLIRDLESFFDQIPLQTQVIISNEKVLSVFFSDTSITRKLNRLRKIFPAAQLLLVIRNQKKIIESQYRDWPFDPLDFHRGKFFNFNDWVTELINNDKQIGFLRSLDYHETYVQLKGVFGRENINVVIFEKLLTDFQSFSSDLGQILGVPGTQIQTLLAQKKENQGVSGVYNRYRMLNRNHPYFAGRLKRVVSLFTKLEKFEKSLKKIGGNRIFWNVDCLNQIEKYYSNSNQRLSKVLNEDLADYGYPK